MKRYVFTLIAVLLLAGQAMAQYTESPIAHLSRADGTFYVGAGSGRIVAETGVTALASLGLTANGRSLVTAENYAAMKTLLAYGTMADQAANSVAITGGTINGATIGGSTAAAGSFTTLATSGNAGIGTASPATRLEIEFANEATAPVVKLENTSSHVNADSSVYFRVNGQDWTMGIDGSQSKAFCWASASALGANKFRMTTSGNFEIYNDNAKLGLGAAGVTDSYIQFNPTGSHLQFYDITTGAKTLAQLAADTDTTYTAGDGLTLTETDFDLDLKTGGGLEIDTGQLRLSTAEAAATQAGSGATATLDFSANAIIKFTFDNNDGATTFTFTDPPAGARCLLILIQDATNGGETVVWPAAKTIYWPDGTAFQPEGTTSARSVVTLVFDGTDYYCTGYDYATAP